MVEALKQAVQKARAMRAQTGIAERPAPQAGVMQTVIPAVTAPVQDDAKLTAVWNGLTPIKLSASHLERSRLITHSRKEPSHAAFDVLRTKLLGVFARKGWTRLGITSPGKGCGKTFTAANLALSLARQADCRTLMVDMDLRAPGLAKTLGVDDVVPLTWLLNNEVEPQNFVLRHGRNLALALNSEKARNPAETVLAASTARALEETQALLQPNVVIYDLPPMLACDDVMGFLPQLDCVLLVVGGGKTRASDVTECERMLADQSQLLGVVLNQAEGVSTRQYGYGSGSD